MLTVTCRRLGALVVLLLPASLAGQGVPSPADSLFQRPDSLSSTESLAGGAVGDAAADSVEGPLLFSAGVGGSLAGISIRGAVPGYTGVLVNGIDVTPGTRGAWVALPTNGVNHAWAVTGPLPARFAAGRALQFDIPSMADSSGARLFFASDRVMGASSLGLTRFGASGGFSGPRYRLFAAGTVQGQKSADFGAGARDLPVFAPVGMDTIVRFATTSGATSDSVIQDIPAWGVTRGDCGVFAGSSDPRIASNYGADCTGDRTPSSAQSRYRVAVNGQYDVNPVIRLGFVALKSRTDQRVFDYRSLNNPANLGGDQELASVYAVTLAGQLRQGESPGTFRIGISRQVNQRMNGPLTPEGELATRDPALGLMLGGLDFRWDFESFPVDSALVNNYRLNRPGSRLSPYDLQNPVQYALRDQYRDSPYGLFGFPEGGGPVGRLTLFRERRTTGFADLSWATSQHSVFRVGGTVARFEVTNYSHSLTTSIFSDVYIERPASGALYAEQLFTHNGIELSAGLRYDIFSSNAERPAALDTLAFIPGSGGTPNPAFGQYQQYPAISSYGIEGQTATINGATLPLRSTIRDQRHSAWSPSLRAMLRIGPGTQVHGGIAREARMPDLAQVFAGINTDLTLTTLAQAYGTDLGFEQSWQAELGLRQQLGEHASLDVTGFHRATDSIAALRLTTLRNPTLNDLPVNVLQFTNAGRWGAQGIVGSLAYATPWLVAMLSYQYLDTDQPMGTAAWNAWSRPHTLSATVHFRAPPSLHSGVLARAQLWAGFRLASGTAYLACRDAVDPLANALTVSDEPCAGLVDLSNALRLPMQKQLDLRFSKAAGDAAWAPRFFVDVRNLLNFRNVIRAFRNPTMTAAARDQVIQQQVENIRVEATMNGAYDASGGTVNLSAPGECGTWVNLGNDGAAPDCVALLRAEARYGNGDGLYTAEEQRAAIGAWFDATYLVGLNGTPRRVRIGIEFGL